MAGWHNKNSASFVPLLLLSVVHLNDSKGLGSLMKWSTFGRDLVFAHTNCTLFRASNTRKGTGLQHSKRTFFLGYLIMVFLGNMM